MITLSAPLQLTAAYVASITILTLLAAVSRWSRKRTALFAAVGLALFIFALSMYTRLLLIPFNASVERRDFLLTGDEPAYLMTALSLAWDGDIDLANNGTDKDYLIFQRRPYLGSDFSFYNNLVHGRIQSREQSWGNARYMRHRPGTSVLLAPVFLLADHNQRFWAYTLLASCFSLFSIFTVLVLAWDSLQLNPMIALSIFLICGLSPPVYFYLNQVYPELPAGILLAMMALLLVSKKLPDLTLFFLGAMVIWFSDRAIPVALILCTGAWFALPNGWKKTAAIIILGTSGALFAWYCWYRFGVPYPISHNTKMGFSYDLLPQRLLQIMFDGKQGWVWLFPPILLLPAIIWQTLREYPQKLQIFSLNLALLAVLILVAAFDDWQGGTNPRGRYYVIPQLLFLTITSIWLKPDQHLRSTRLFWLIGLGGLSLMQLYWLVPHPKWWFARYHPLFTWKAIQHWYAFIPQLPDHAPMSEWIKLMKMFPFMVLPSLACLLLKEKKNPGTS